MRHLLIIFSVFLFSFTIFSCSEDKEESTTDTTAQVEVLPSYVAVDTSGRILTSSDGTSWDNKSSGTTGNLNGVTYGNDKFITVGNSGTILTSSNGTSWNSTSWTCSACTDNISAYTLSDVTYKD